MARAMAADLADQYRRSFQMLYSEVERFDQRQWITGLSPFLSPVNQATHIIDCLDFYFSGKKGEDYPWCHRFGGWWELSADQQPDQAAVLAYGREIEARIMAELATLDDADLTRPLGDEGAAATLLGHYVYALRHTMHHHGELAALAVHHTGDGGSWE
jgi:hypothetical protein